MRETSLRWGLGMGAIGAGLGIVALLLGITITPKGAYPPAEAVATAFFFRGLLVLLTLGLTLGLAYYAGLRSELARAASPAEAEGTGRRDALFAGAITLFCYWFITSIYLFVLSTAGNRTAAPGTGTPLLDFLENRLIIGAISVIFGAGMGALGGRALAARRLLASLPPLGAPASAAHERAEPVVQPTPSEALPEG